MLFGQRLVREYSTHTRAEDQPVGRGMFARTPEKVGLCGQCTQRRLSGGQSSDLALWGAKSLLYIPFFLRKEAELLGLEWAVGFGSFEMLRRSWLPEGVLM